MALLGLEPLEPRDTPSAPALTSPDHATFYTGFAKGFSVTAAGDPYPALALNGNLPAGLKFTPPNGFLFGTAAAGTEGTYHLTLTAANGDGPPAVQPFTLDVRTGVFPDIPTPNTARFAAGVGGTFHVAATGNPMPALSEDDPLPAGVTFDPATGTLAVAPTVPAGDYDLTFTASSELGQHLQGFRLTLGTAPVFTSPARAVFLAGQANTFGVTASGNPGSTFAVTAGTLPAGITLDPTGLLHGGSAAAGLYPVTVTADNGIGRATQALTVVVGQPPALTSAPATTVNAGGTFTVTASGVPAPALAETFALPPGVTFDPATGVLGVNAATPAGTYQLNFLATNEVGYAYHTFTLTVVPPAAPPPPPPSQVATGGQPGSTTVFTPNPAGQFGGTPTAVPNPFGLPGVVIRSAVGDVNGDGTPDTVTITGPGATLRFAVVSGKDNSTLLVAPTAPFTGSEDFTGGGFVSVGDLDGDGRADIVVTPDQGGGPRVSVFALPAGGGLVRRADFLGIDDPTFRGGARTAVGDVNHDGRPDLAVAAGYSGGPRVALFSGAAVLTTRAKLVNDFFAFPGTDAVTLRNGAYVAVGDVTGDGFAELIFGGGPGGAPRVFVLDGARVAAGDVAGAQASPVANFFVGNNAADRGGARVAAADADRDGRADVVVGSGAGAPARVRIYPAARVAGATGEPGGYQDLVPFGGNVLVDGVYVG